MVGSQVGRLECPSKMATGTEGAEMEQVEAGPLSSPKMLVTHSTRALVCAHSRRPPRSSGSFSFIAVERTLTKTSFPSHPVALGGRSLGAGDDGEHGFGKLASPLLWPDMTTCTYQQVHARSLISRSTRNSCTPRTRVGNPLSVTTRHQSR